MHTGLWAGAQIFFRQKGKNLATASLLLHCIDGYSWLGYWNEFFFHLFFRFQIEIFSYCTFTETFAIGFQNRFDHKWIDVWVLSRNMVFFVDFISVWTEICKNCWKLFPFWWHQFISITSFRDTLFCCLNVLVLFMYCTFYVGLCKIDW